GAAVTCFPFFFQAEDGIRDFHVTGVQTCALPILATMLGTVDRTRVGALLSALSAGDGKALLDEIATLAEFSPDWAGVLDAMAERSEERRVGKEGRCGWGARA